uniref:Uncharacterized protein n=1 Tax=Populus trichocarpa TaxID=3694 RepID=A0A2K2C0Y9_POPTR
MDTLSKYRVFFHVFFTILMRSFLTQFLHLFNKIVCFPNKTLVSFTSQPTCCYNHLMNVEISQHIKCNPIST